MNLVGKICVLVILVLSLVFMTLSLMVYSTHRNWREEATQVGKERDQARAKNDDLQQQLQQLDGELAAEKTAYVEQLQKLETERAQLIAQRNEMQERLAQRITQNRELTGVVGATQQRLTSLVQEVGGLRAKIVDAQQQRDSSFENVVKKTEQLHQAHADLVRAKERENQLVAQVARYTQRMQDEGVDPNAPPKGSAPAIDGLVTAVGEDNLIEVSLGSDDGLRAGHTIEVYRGQSYLGRAEVVRTAPDKSVAKILRQYRRGIIQRGDHVATRLKVS